MPKKKQKKQDNGDKQDKVMETSKGESSPSPADKSESADKDKDLYLTQIRHLTDQLERYQLKCDQQEKQKEDLTSQFSALETEKKDIVDYLKHSLLRKEDEVEELTERLESERQAACEDKEALQLQHGQLRQELQQRIEEVNTENVTLVTRLASLEEFQSQWEQLTSNLTSLENQVASQKEEHKAAIHNLEMKALLEKKRLEKEKESQVAAMVAAAEQDIPETTRLALQENVEMKAWISQLSEQTQVLMGENCTLRDRKGRLSVEVSSLEQMLSEMTRNICVRKKVVEQLTEKCQQLQAELKDCRQELKQLQTKHTGVLAEMEALRGEQAQLSEQCRNNKGEVSRLQAELQEERRRGSRMKSIMQEAVVTLRRALMDAPTDQDSEENIQWKQLMEKLLVVLDRSEPNNSTAENHHSEELQTSDSEVARAVALNPALSFQFELARYRPGDLGLVPRPTLKHKHVPCGTGAAGSSSTHVPLHRKPTSQKTDTSMKRTDSAVRRLTSTNSATKPK